MTENPQHPHVLRMRAAFEKSSAGPWIILLAGVIMCNISWLKRPDLLVDYGERVYVSRLLHICIPGFLPFSGLES